MVEHLEAECAGISGMLNDVVAVEAAAAAAKEAEAATSRSRWRPALVSCAGLCWSLNASRGWNTLQADSFMLLDWFGRSGRGSLSQKAAVCAAGVVVVLLCRGRSAVPARVLHVQHDCSLHAESSLASASMQHVVIVLQGLQTTRLGLAVFMGAAVFVAACAGVASAFIALSIKGCSHV